MAEPIKFLGANAELQPPSLNSKILPLPVMRNDRTCTSVWKLDDAEMARVMATGCVQVMVFFGGSQPPIAVTAPEMRAEGGAE